MPIRKTGKSRPHWGYEGRKSAGKTWKDTPKSGIRLRKKKRDVITTEKSKLLPLGRETRSVLQRGKEPHAEKNLVVGT